MSVTTPQAPFRPSPAPHRTAAVALVVILAFVGVGGQLVRLAFKGQHETISSTARPLTTNFARPDIVDRQGRLLATDIAMPSLFADPAIVIDRDETVENLATIFPDLDQAELRRSLAERNRRFAWIKRGLAPATAQRVHDLGLPGLDFRYELRRSYPAGRIAGHLVGHVDIDNKGMAGVERHIDEHVGVEAVQGTRPSGRAPLRLSIDLGVQHTLEEELRDAARLSRASGAAGTIIDARTGEILASASLPEVDPARLGTHRSPGSPDKVLSGVFELGSIFKAFTVAMALDGGQATVDSLIDVREPLKLGRFTIEDLHPSERPLSVSEIFIRSSNIGAGLLAKAAGAERQREFLSRLGLVEPILTEAGPVARPLVPARWGEIETITIAYGHGIAVAPLQVAAAAAALVNGGTRVRPTFVRRAPGDDPPQGERVISQETSARLRELMRANVTEAHGTGWRADAPGYRVGGKTGTANIASGGRYRASAVISSFLAAFPMDAPQYVVLVLLFEPQRTAETDGERLAGTNAAPLAGRVVARIAPLLGVVPVMEEAMAEGR